MTALAEIVPAVIRAARYARISHDQAGDEHGVKNQLADQARLAEVRGYQVVMTEDDNDISALNGKRRPGYEAVMAAAAAGQIDVILVFQTSRFWRNRRERAEGIEILRKAGVSIVATKGPSLDMSDAYGRAMAGILGEFDTMEVEVKGERQRFANGEAAKQGTRRRGAPRSFGFERTHERCTLEEHRCTWHHRPDEAEAIRAAARLLLGGGSLSGVMREWNQRGLRPAQAPFGPLRERPWTRQSIRTILLNPVMAGLPVYDGEVIGLAEGATIDWQPILTEETWQAVKAKLEAPERKPPRGVRTLLGGMALCGCANHVEGTTNHKRARVYRCAPPTRPPKSDWPGGHVCRESAPIDDYVERVVIERLSRPDAAGLLRAPEPRRADVAALREEYTAIRANLDELAGDRALGLIDKSQMIRATERGRARMAEIDAQIAGAAQTDVLAGLAGGPDARQMWGNLDLSRQRAVIKALMTVTLLSPGRGSRREFDAQTVRIDWLRD
jgi:site-specific DNA recombinase